LRLISLRGKGDIVYGELMLANLNLNRPCEACEGIEGIFPFHQL